MLLAETADVESAIDAAWDAFPGWSQTSVSARTKVMFAFRELVNANAERLAEAITDEHGKVLSDALGEVQRGLEVVEFACGIPSLLKGDYSDQVSSGVDTFSFREPLGVVAGITPFNFPAMVPMWMFPVAIACGNTFVLKPSERDPSASLLIAELWRQAGLPDGVFNVVHGDKVAVDAILDSPEVAAVSFVGSTPIARYIHERGSASGKRVQALGGAKNHAIVLPDARRRLRRRPPRRGRVRLGRRAVHGDLGGRRGRLGRRRGSSRRSPSGPGRSRSAPAATPRSEMGPVVTREAQQRILGLIDSGEKQGADDRGRRPRAASSPGHEDGFFVGPTVIDQVSTEMDVYREEIFGPVLSVVRVGRRRRGDRADQRQPLRQRHRDLHLVGRGRPPVPARGQRRDDRHQRAGAGADGVLLLRRLEGLAVRRQARPRPRGRGLLHPRQGRHRALARSSRRRAAPASTSPPPADGLPMTSPELLTVGRVGVDLYPEQSGVPLKDVATFAKSLGGTATNVAVGAARLGHRTAVLTKVGPDGFGDYVREALTGFGVDASYVGTAAGLQTPVVFCELNPPEDPPLTFYRAPIAPDLTLTADDVPWDVVAEVPVLWVTGTGVSVEPARTTQLDDAGPATASRGRLRPLDRARPRLARDVLALAGGGPRRVRRDARPRHGRPSATGPRSRSRSAPATRTRRPSGCSPAASSSPWSRWAARGCWSRPRRSATVVPPHPVEVVCGLGAGDAFGGALVHGLLSGWDPAAMRRVRQRRRRAGRLAAGLRRRDAHRRRARRHGRRPEEPAHEHARPSPTSSGDGLLATRATDPGAVAKAYAARRRPGRILSERGTLFLVAADHPARGALASGGDPMAMADRRSLLARLVDALSHPDVDGVLGTPDVVRSCCCWARWRTRWSSAR